MTKTISSKYKKYFITVSNNFIDIVLTLIILAIMLIIISSPETFTIGTIAGVKLFFYSVFPGLFPFMFLTKLLTEIGYVYKISPKFDRFTKKVFGTSGISIYVLLMSILSGYPIGAKIIDELYSKNLITENEAKKLSVFCTTSGPIFIIGAVGVGMLKSFQLGLIIYIAHILSSIVIGIIFNLFSKNKQFNNSNTPQITIKKQDNLFSYCLLQTLNSILAVGAYITIFYVITELLDKLNIISFIQSLFCFITGTNNSNLVKGFIYGIIEVTHGAKVLSSHITPTTVSLICGIISFSGLSIVMQSMMFLKNAKIKTHKFVLTKCVHLILSLLFCKILLSIFSPSL